MEIIQIGHRLEMIDSLPAASMQEVAELKAFLDTAPIKESLPSSSEGATHSLIAWLRLPTILGDGLRTACLRKSAASRPVTGLLRMIARLIRSPDVDADDLCGISQIESGVK